ncbi:DUF4919 domain-containing protein [Cesiribacter sp. SM1]|uniref:DUF4919 domain-containing protein n=1 Tax=Cesiribacter sp. SM1 TaxID=2861196 RepID=UPI001CD470BD|nr:DUF4919 domain-containing protein [Cesiribacter sp. SM1]
MKHSITITLLLSLLMSGLAYSQDKVAFDYTNDYGSILKLTKDPNSEIFYDKLFKRFEDGDTTLTNYEMIALQIGYTDNPKYWPYQDISLEREIWDLNEKKEFEKAKSKLDTLLTNNPFSILGHREMSYVYSKLGDKSKADLHFQKFDLVVLSVLSTGDGTSYETSWFTLSPADGQWIIKLAFRQSVCSMGSGRDKNGNFHDILGIQFEDADDCKELFFNIQPAAKRMFGPEGLPLDGIEEVSINKKENPEEKKKRKKKGLKN